MGSARILQHDAGEKTRGEARDVAVAGEREISRFHPSNLLRRDSTFYFQFGCHEPPDLTYVWPL